MNSLNLDQIKQDASRRLQLTTKIEELQSLVDGLYSGYKVLVVRPDEAQSANVAITSHEDFSALSGVKQMRHILLSKPLTSRELHEDLKRKGASIELPTVMSTLSRKKDVFKKTNDGKWTIV